MAVGTSDIVSYSFKNQASPCLNGGPLGALDQKKLTLNADFTQGLGAARLPSAHTYQYFKRRQRGHTKLTGNPQEKEPKSRLSAYFLGQSATRRREVPTSSRQTRLIELQYVECITLQARVQVGGSGLLLSHHHPLKAL